MHLITSSTTFSSSPTLSNFVILNDKIYMRCIFKVYILFKTGFITFQQTDENKEERENDYYCNDHLLEAIIYELTLFQMKGKLYIFLYKYPVTQFQTFIYTHNAYFKSLTIFQQRKMHRGTWIN